jgi:hypothetical protein
VITYSPAPFASPSPLSDLSEESETESESLSFRSLLGQLGLSLKYIPMRLDASKNNALQKEEIRRHGVLFVKKMFESIRNSYGDDVAAEVRTHVSSHLHRKQMAVDSVCDPMEGRSSSVARESASPSDTSDINGSSNHNVPNFEGRNENMQYPRLRNCDPHLSTHSASIGNDGSSD